MKGEGGRRQKGTRVKGVDEYSKLVDKLPGKTHVDGDYIALFCHLRNINYSSSKLSS